VAEDGHAPPLPPECARPLAAMSDRQDASRLTKALAPPNDAVAEDGHAPFESMNDFRCDEKDQLLFALRWRCGRRRRWLDRVEHLEVAFESDFIGCGKLCR
jgi:hypothetical protein